MEVSSTRIPLYQYTSDNGKDKDAFIEIANERKGGVPSWGNDSSIRKTLFDINSGKFDRRASHELPTHDISQMVEEGANDDVFTRGECIAMINALNLSLQRLP